MGTFVAKQPNGKYCLFSTVVDCPTHINMSIDDYIQVMMSRGFQKWKAEQLVNTNINNHLYPFTTVLEFFKPYNMTEENFNKYVEKMKDNNGKFELTVTS